MAVAGHPGCVLLLDIAMPGMNGLDVARRLAERGDDVRVVMLSAREDRDALFSAYLCRRARLRRQGLRARAAVRRHRPRLAGRHGAQHGRRGEPRRGHPPARATAPAWCEQRRLALTDRELEILRLLATPTSPAQMASELFLSKKTVQNHISAIYRKLGVKSRSEAIVRGMELHLIAARG